ncbi:uncharacterized protein N7498_006608 [Penicillium cinerascens]|uniref:Helix-turn-helix domain-containing protein n=1 Tax=Penicillium cinerascens TaxID=70096 RepID=A0A9W9MII6_9EURO|nr:uncharacterized protein N7498_006608 [Penicillium cinerascens]KAJ5201945.1 hypothetical protein N7498_006608 [Penicillium cinerascens]
MGSSASKPARAAAGAAKRQYPKRAAPPPRAPTAPPSETKAKAPEGPTPQPAPSPPPSQPPSSGPQGPTYHSKEPPSVTRSSAIDLDGRDPDFAASLRSLGPVDPSGNYAGSPTFSRGPMQTVFPTASNPALLTAAARDRITKAAQQEIDQMGRPDFAGRSYMDALMIHQALTMRDVQKMPSVEIERTLHLKKGTMNKLGVDGLISRAT